MKIYNKIIIVLLLLALFIYTCNATLLPNCVFCTLDGESLKFNAVLQASSNLNKNKINDNGTIDVSLNLFGTIPIKRMQADVVPNVQVVPVGKAVGMKLYTDGVLVVGMSEIEGKKPYENTGIAEGDIIVQINKENIDSTDDLIETVNRNGEKAMQITYKRNNDMMTAIVKPAKTADNEYKLGLWVRDAAAGVGTVTFYEPDTKKYAALGHGITDIDTGELISIANGELVTTKILSIVKGTSGLPGEIRGTIENGKILGNVSKNTGYGVYGKISNEDELKLKNESNKMPVATRNQIHTGKAKILCQLDEGNTESYDIEIQKLFLNNNENNKSMIIKITDSRLIDKTGGIIQGMSGAPIIQDEKFVGAVTHVLVNDPTVGYGVFADIMIKQLEEVN